MLAGLSAQEVSDTKKINEIKRNTKYLYAEATTKTADESRQVAMELLNTYIEDYVASESKLSSADKIIIKDVESKSESIQMKRGDMVRVFVYVKKADIIPATDNTTVIVNENKTEPVVKEKKKKKSDAETVTVPPAQVEPIAGDASLKLEVAWQQAVVDDLLECNTFAEARALLSRLKAEYKVKRHGSPNTCKDSDGSFWMIEGDDGKVAALLGPGNGQRTNFKTMQPDSLDNYSGSTAVWFTLSK